MKAIDVVAELKARIAELPEEARFEHMTRFVTAMAHALSSYEEQAEADKIEVESMKQEHFEDKRIHEVATQYGMTANQVFVYMDVCDKMNTGSLAGTGIVAVPFWFHEQYVATRQLNEQLTSESENLVQTVKRISDQHTEDLSGYIPERQSIVTGVTAPYIPGVTGPRPGDEHLDPESIYNLNR